MKFFLMLCLMCFVPVLAQANPTEKYPDSHWDVYEVTNLNWKSLTDSQKFQFVAEAFQELLRTNQDVSIGIKPDHEKSFWEDVGFLEEVIKRSYKEGDKPFSMMDFYFEVLKMQGRVHALKE